MQCAVCAVRPVTQSNTGVLCTECWSRSLDGGSTPSADAGSAVHLSVNGVSIGTTQDVAKYAAVAGDTLSAVGPLGVIALILAFLANSCSLSIGANEHGIDLFHLAFGVVAAILAVATLIASRGHEKSGQRQGAAAVAGAVALVALLRSVW